MKNNNKYLNLVSGMAYLAINSGGILFAVLASYGLMMIRDFAIKHLDNNLKILSEALLVLNLTRATIGLFGATSQVYALSNVLVLLNVVVFILTFFVLGMAVRHLSIKLNEFELNHSISKVNESFYIIIAADMVIVVISLLAILTLYYPIPALINLISLFSNQNINLIVGVGLTLVKYLASRSFTKAGSLLLNAITFENKTNIQ